MTRNARQALLHQVMTTPVGFGMRPSVSETERELLLYVDMIDYETNQADAFARMGAYVGGVLARAGLTGLVDTDVSMAADEHKRSYMITVSVDRPDHDQPRDCGADRQKDRGTRRKKELIEQLLRRWGVVCEHLEHIRRLGPQPCDPPTEVKEGDFSWHLDRVSWLHTLSVCEAIGDKEYLLPRLVAHYEGSMPPEVLIHPSGEARDLDSMEVLVWALMEGARKDMGTLLEEYYA